MLKLLQWGQPTRPWRLKCPSHLLWLDALDRVFPDARFVMTHRDPAEVMVSVADLYCEVAKQFSVDVDPTYMGALNVDHWTVAMERLLAFRAGGAEDRFYDLGFRAVQQDPIGAVRGLYDWLGEPVTDEFEAGMSRWWEENAARREENIHPEPAEFGLDLDEVRARVPRLHGGDGDMDLTGGLDPEREFVLAAQPDDPEMRESVNAWVWDDGDAFGLPRLGVEAVGDQWDTHDLQVNLALAGGRVVTMFQPGEVHEPLGADGRPRVLGAGPAALRAGRAVPSTGGRRWTAPAPRSPSRTRSTGGSPAARASRCRSSWSWTSAPPSRRGRSGPCGTRRRTCWPPRRRAPSWAAPASSSSSGRPVASGSATRSTTCAAAASASAARASASSPPSGATPGSRPCSRAGGPSATSPTRRGTTARRPSTRASCSRATATWSRPGSCRRRGSATSSRRGQDVSVVLETEQGTTTIQGETILSTFMVVGPLEGFALHQAITRYRWDGEEANGMIERSTGRGLRLSRRQSPTPSMRTWVNRRAGDPPAVVGATSSSS